MDREEASRLLRNGEEGIREFNRRRKKGESVSSLAGIDFSGVDLTGPIEGADLSDLDLSHASFLNARLGGRHKELSFPASFRNTVFTRSRLRDAKFDRADLHGAVLSRADLSRSSLIFADLSQAKLLDADLTQAICASTTFNSVDLGSVKGLETVKHLCPSSIGLDTIYAFAQRSAARIPDEFLRGCGVPEEWITFIPSLVGSLRPIDFYSCFVSHSTKDEEFCKRLHGRLRQDNVRVWYAAEDMKRGQKIHEQIESAIRVHDKLLVVLSEQSMASEWVEHEIYTARQREERDGRKVLFPVALCAFDEIKAWKCFDADTGRDMAREIREYYIPDFSNWKNHDSFEAEYDKLLRDLKKTAEEEQAAGVTDTR